jgi:hypothetical protein
MARAERNVQVTFSVKMMSLTESECRALDALVGYGDDAFLDVFKKSLGEHYIRDHEAGLRSFFSTVRKEVLPGLRQIDQLREAIADTTAQENP